MISPTPRAVWAMLIGVPLFLLTAIFAPSLWVGGVGWITLMAGAMLADSVLAAKLSSLSVNVEAPAVLYIDGKAPARAHIHFVTGPLPKRLDVRLEANTLIAPPGTKGLRGFQDRRRSYDFPLTPIRRGEGELRELWVRWAGPLGLIHKHRREPLNIPVPITPNIQWVKAEAIRLYARDADFGIKMQIDRGDGSEFDALREFAAGMDRRAIDWKHSARHRELLAKEFRTERNHNIILAFDTGRLMSEPLGGVPKIDRAINAGLLLAYICLRAGDKTALYGFDARPGIASGLLSGRAAFPQMQALATRLEYSPADANYTLALTELAGRLERRSLIILFTDFVDTISAEMMLETVGRLTEKHLVLFATFQDETLGQFVAAPPLSADDVGRAVIADSLLQERDLVFRRLHRLGAHVLETRPEQFGTALISRYVEIKQRNML